MARYKTLTAVAAAAALFLTSGVALAATPKIGIINVNYIIAHSARGQAAQQALQQMIKEKKGTLDEKKAQLKDTRAKLRKIDNKKTESFKKKFKEYRQSFAQFQKKVKKSQRAISKRRAELLNPIIEDLHKVLQQYAEKHNYTLILNTSTKAVAYAAQSYNINDELVKALNQYEGEQ